MNKPIGGRGVKAPYETTHVRIPVPIKATVERLIDQFREGGIENQENSLTGLYEAILIAQGILNQKKSAKLSMQKLLTAIYGQKVEL